MVIENCYNTGSSHDPKNKEKHKRRASDVVHPLKKDPAVFKPLKQRYTSYIIRMNFALCLIGLGPTERIRFKLDLVQPQDYVRF